MKYRKPLIFLITAAIAASAICCFWKPAPYEEAVIRIQMEQEVAYIDPDIMNEPLEAQLMLLDYSPNKALTLKAWLALSKYPEKTRHILSLYGSEPEFKEILITYGEAIIPPIQYFYDTDIRSVAAMNSISQGIGSAADSANRLWNRLTGDPQTISDPAPKAQPAELSPRQRGWYAINFIRQEGHGFLGQFVVTTDQQVKWLQTERILEGITTFFASGLRTLETKYVLGDDITAGDVFWAGVDVTIAVGTLKLLRAGKAAAQSTRQLSLVSRTRIFASRMLSQGKIFQKLGKYGALAATAYIIVSHPSLINSVLSEAARMMGLNPWIVQFAGWSLIIMIALYPFSWILKSLARFVVWIFSWIEPARMKPAYRYISR